MKPTICISPAHLADLGPDNEAALRELFIVETQDLAMPMVPTEIGRIDEFRIITSHHEHFLERPEPHRLIPIERGAQWKRERQQYGRRK